MGNCLSKRCRQNPQKPYEEHSHVKKNFRIGIQGEKTPDGEIHIGFKAGVETHKDIEVKLEDLKQSEDLKNGSCEEDLKSLENIPTLKDLMFEKESPKKMKTFSIPEQ